MKLKRLFGRHRTPAPPPPPSPPKTPQPAVPVAEVSLPPVAVSQPRFTPLEARLPAPRARRPDVALATRDADLALWGGDVRGARQRLDQAQKIHPNAGLPVLKNMLCCARLRDTGSANGLRLRLVELVPSPFDRAVLWSSLFWDQAEAPAHRVYRHSMEDLLTAADSERLMPGERWMLLQRSASHRDGDLLKRAVYRGNASDLRALLNFLAPCDDMATRRPELLAICLEGNDAGKVSVLLEAGTRPANEAAWRRLATIAVQARTGQLLQRALEHGLDPNLVVNDAEGPWTLAQGAAKSDAVPMDKVERLAKAGASLSQLPRHTKLLSPFRALTRLGPWAVRQLLDLGLGVNETDARSGNTLLHDAVEDQRVDCVEPLLRAGASPLLRRPDGMDALALADHMGLTSVRHLIERYEEVAKWRDYVARHLSQEPGYDPSSRAAGERLDRIAEALYRVPPSGVQTVLGIADTLHSSDHASHDYIEFALLCCKYEGVLTKASEQARSRLLRVLQGCGGSCNRSLLGVLCERVPVQDWCLFFEHIPWFERNMPLLNGEIVATTAGYYGAMDPRVVLAVMDNMRFVPRAFRHRDTARKVTRLFMELESKRGASLWLAAWCTNSWLGIQHNAFSFLSMLEKKQEDMLKIDYLYHELQPMRERPAPLIFDDQAPPVRKAELPKVILPEALQAVLDTVPLNADEPLCQRKLNTLKVEDLRALHGSLTHPNVEDDIVDFDDVANAVMDVIRGMIGRDVLNAIYANPGAPTLSPTRRLFLACHPDKVAQQERETATELSQTLTAIRTLLTHEERGPKLAQAFVRTRTS